jgi:hypothetical protein
MSDRFDFDELAQELARGLSRRQALRRLAEGFTGAVLACMGVGRAWGQGISDCAHFCNGVFPAGPERGRCVSDAAQHQGLCYGCGPAALAGHPDLCGAFGGPRYCCSAALPDCCGAACVDTQTDSLNCGACGNACAAGEACRAGVCAPRIIPICTSGFFACGSGCCQSLYELCRDGACVSCNGGYACGDRCCNPPQLCGGIQNGVGTCACDQSAFPGSFSVTCGSVCCDGSAYICQNGACMGCPVGQSPCVDHCCPENTSCTLTGDPDEGSFGGVCTCDAGFSACGSTCCNSHELCQNGACMACPNGGFVCGDRCCGTNQVCAGVQNGMGTCACDESDPERPTFACGSVCCFGSQMCQNGACAFCPAGQSACLDRCCPEHSFCDVFVISNPNNPGPGSCICDTGYFACGSVCCAQGTDACINGMCQRSA